MSGDAWDDAIAQRLEGSTVLVGLTYDEPSGARLEQFFGTVMSLDPSDGIVVRLEGSRSGELKTLPPHLENFFAASPGTYRLRESGDVVHDPDYTATWTITRPPN